MPIRWVLTCVLIRGWLVGWMSSMVDAIGDLAVDELGYAPDS
jgi:hypothetical protein